MVSREILERAVVGVHETLVLSRLMATIMYLNVRGATLSPSYDDIQFLSYKPRGVAQSRGSQICDQK